MRAVRCWQRTSSFSVKCCRITARGQWQGQGRDMVGGWIGGWPQGGAMRAGAASKPACQPAWGPGAETPPHPPEITPTPHRHNPETIIHDNLPRRALQGVPPARHPRPAPRSPSSLLCLCWWRLMLAPSSASRLELAPCRLSRSFNASTLRPQWRRRRRWRTRGAKAAQHNSAPRLPLEAPLDHPSPPPLPTPPPPTPHLCVSPAMVRRRLSTSRRTRSSSA